MKVAKSELEILQPVIQMAREELADMESDDIPAGVRKATKSSARRLPAPLARSVFNELVRNDEYRSAVGERYSKSGDTDDDLVAFLEDPTVAMEQISVRASTAAGDDMRTSLEASHQRIAELESQLAEARHRNASLLNQHVQELGIARSSISDGQVRSQARMERMEVAATRRADEISALELEVAGLTSELTATEDRLAAAIRKIRRKVEVGGESGERYRIDSTSSDPLELASWLDNVERNIRPFRERGVLGRHHDSTEPLRIDPGVAPDSASAVASLISQHPRRFLLDGYNIGGEIHADGFSTRAARDDVVHRAGTLARSTDADVWVVFDGPGDEARSGFLSSDGVTVRFSRGDKADDVIAALVASDPARTVVITNDRDLRDRCSIDGCIPIWSTAFLDWL